LIDSRTDFALFSFVALIPFPRAIQRRTLSRNSAFLKHASPVLKMEDVASA
jgi:hypothetical protein